MNQRTERLGTDIQAALGELLVRGEVKDPRVRNVPLITITHVAVTGDLREARVRFTAFGADAASLERVKQGLTAARAHLQHELARRLRTRNTPLLSFEVDRSLDQAFEINRILREVNAADAAVARARDDAGEAGAAASEPSAATAEEDTDGDSDGDDGAREESGKPEAGAGDAAGPKA